MERCDSQLIKYLLAPVPQPHVKYQDAERESRGHQAHGSLVTLISAEQVVGLNTFISVGVLHFDS